MMITELNIRDKAPASGSLLAYSRKEVFFKEYSSFEEAESIVDGIELLEIHLFDDEREYRAVVSESNRFPYGYAEHIADFTKGDAFHIDNNDKHTHIYGDVYVEKCRLEESSAVLTVLNHISYDNNGMITIDDYRLVPGGK